MFFLQKQVYSARKLFGMVLAFAMLDHTRMLFYIWNANPVDTEHTNWPLFLTRFLSHFFAPAVFLFAGAAIYRDQQYASKKQHKIRLLYNGVLLIVIDIGLNNFLYTFDVGYHTLGLLILSVLGICILLMPVLEILPKKGMLILSLVILFGHPLLNYLPATESDWMLVLRSVLHKQRFIPVNNRMYIINYTLFPWLGILMLGYVLGPFFMTETTLRKHAFSFKIAGIACIALFLILRLFFSYGDPFSWHKVTHISQTVFSFFNLTKYPASPCFVLFTLGSIFLLLSRPQPSVFPPGRFFSLLAERPLFTYLASTFLLHLAAMIIYRFSYGNYEGMIITPQSYKADSPLSNYGFSLEYVYAIWLALMALFACINFFWTKT